MSGRGGYEGMETSWTDAEFDAALANGEGAPLALTSFVAAVRATDQPAMPDNLARTHIVAAAAAAGEAAAAAATKTSTVPKRGRIRRRLTLAGLASGFWAKLALGAVAVAAVGGGAAATDNLPDSIQAAVSEAAGWVGVDLPNPEDVPPSTLAGNEEAPEAVRNGPQDPGELPEGGGNSDAARTHAVAVTTWAQCRVDFRKGLAEDPTEEQLLAECGERPEAPTPENAGPSEDKGKPDDAGPPEDKGKPDDAGPPEDKPDKPEKPEKPDKPG